MLLYIVLLIPAISASFISNFQRQPTYNDICDTNPFEHCKPDVKLEFPQNEAEVEKTCDVLPKFEECVLNHIQVCQTEVPIQEIFESRVFNKLCDRDGTLYRDFVDNTNCLAKVVNKTKGHDICHTQIKAAKEKHPERFEKISQIFREESDSEEAQKLRHCLETAVQIGCVVAETKEVCGIDAVHFEMKIIEEAKLFETVCLPNHLQVLEEAMAILDFDFI